MTITNILMAHHLRKPSVRFSLTPISPLADFNATEMPPIGMNIKPTCVLISQKKKILSSVGFEPGNFGFLDLLSNQFGHASSPVINGF
jgi:hypothetical protein